MAVDKHINYFELEKACQKPGCPLCRIIRDRSWRYLDNMLFEHVSDRGFRALHRGAGGFCPEHSAKLVNFRDGLAVAILGRDILEDRIRHFKSRKPWRPRGTCPVCLERKRIEQEYLSFLLEVGEERPDDRALVQWFTASEGLCAPHYGMLLELKKRPPRWLVQFQEEKFSRLLERVNRFIELSAYGRQQEFAALPEADKLVWKELARTLRGSGDAEKEE